MFEKNATMVAVCLSFPNYLPSHAAQHCDHGRIPCKVFSGDCDHGRTLFAGTKRTAKGAAQYCDYGLILFVLNIKKKSNLQYCCQSHLDQLQIEIY